LQEKDKIMIKNPFPRKPDDRFEGPYEIEKIVGPSTFMICLEDGKHQLVHISRIKPYHERRTEE